MNLRDMIRVARIHFANACVADLLRQAVYTHYIIDEISLPRTEWDILLCGVISGSTSDLEKRDETRFFTWYFINYVVDMVVDELLEAGENSEDPQNSELSSN